MSLVLLFNQAAVVPPVIPPAPGPFYGAGGGGRYPAGDRIRSRYTYTERPSPRQVQRVQARRVSAEREIQEARAREARLQQEIQSRRLERILTAQEQEAQLRRERDLERARARSLELEAKLAGIYATLAQLQRQLEEAQQADALEALAAEEARAQSLRDLVAGRVQAAELQAGIDAETARQAMLRDEDEAIAIILIAAGLWKNKLTIH